MGISKTDVRIWLFLLGYIAILFTTSILFKGVEFRLVRLGLTYITVLIYILFIVSSHYMLIGLRPNSRVFNLSILIPILIVLAALNLYGINWTGLKGSGAAVITLMIIVLFIQCLCEELIFRGVVFRYFLMNSNRLFHSAVLSSVMFSCFHLLSISKVTDYTIVGNQLIASFFLGLFLVGLYTYSRNLGISILAHTIINLPSYANRIAIQEEIMPVISESGSSFNPLQILFAAIYYLPYGIAGYFLISRSRNEFSWR